ncbi:LysR family transcriptional regulator [Sulfitobacter sp. D35]|uniref:LysR family transcriptional regulator n=1 Tax=Sulfitobacter sp. D35 TaxID=3083252 RepID=UPI002970021A|nr:LysR family transcriptional regulator [Sulfitobacter sp. D35]MDW4498161.1 LysR family transcriptional regulator [Sulfitobacter sp. D35]
MNLGSFDLNLLRVLDALLREESTTKAGQRIGLSQPAVSAALGRLRAALNDPLFVRVGQRLEPTDYARALALPLGDLLDRVEHVLAGPPVFDPAVSTDRFKISGSDFFAEMLMPQLAERLAREAPRMRMQLVDLVPDNYLGKLETYDVDLALIPRPAHLPAWTEWRPLFNSSFAMIARRGHPALADLAEAAAVPMDVFCALGHILFSPEGNLSAMGDAALAKVGRKRQVVMTMPVFYGVCSAVAESDHVALIPQQMAYKIARKLDLTVHAPPMPMPLPLIGMVWHRRASASAPHRWLRDRIADLMEPLNAGEPPLPTAG